MATKSVCSVPLTLTIAVAGLAAATGMMYQWFSWSLGSNHPTPILIQPDAIETLFDGVPLGAEAFIQDDAGNILASLADGRIIRFSEKNTKQATSFETIGLTGHEKCEADLKNCGRPLGLRFFPYDIQRLALCDAYRGLLSLDLGGLPPLDKGGKGTASTASGGVSVARSLVGERTSQNHFKFADSLDFFHVQELAEKEKMSLQEKEDIIKEETEIMNYIVFSDASKSFSLDNVVLSLTETTPTGRLVAYRIRDGKTTDLVSDLRFPNGVVRSHDGKEPLVTLTTQPAIGKLNGEGKWTVCNDRFPFLPDNIHRHPYRNTYLVAGTIAATPVLQLLRVQPFAWAMTAAWNISLKLLSVLRRDTCT